MELTWRNEWVCAQTWKQAGFECFLGFWTVNTTPCGLGPPTDPQFSCGRSESFGLARVQLEHLACPGFMSWLPACKLSLGTIEPELSLVDGNGGATQSNRRKNSSTHISTTVFQVFHHPEKKMAILKMHKLPPFMMTSQVTLVLNI